MVVSYMCVDITCVGMSQVHTFYVQNYREKKERYTHTHTPTHTPTHTHTHTHTHPHTHTPTQNKVDDEKLMI